MTGSGPKASGAPLAAGVRLGPYEILAPLGAGGMGAVYRARDTRLSREVAIKVLPAEVSDDRGRLRRFEKEALAASALNHPNIVTIYDVGSADSHSYIAMERVEGQTLRELLVGGPLTVKKLLPIAAQIAAGLAKAHEAGIVHRDLKPENVMVTKDGLVKVLDFGLAKLTHSGIGSDEGAQVATESATSPGVVVGTAAYMSPEQASARPIDFRSDQFALGSMLYEMATGEPAFVRKTGIDTLAAILNDEPEPIGVKNPRVPLPLRWIIEQCLSKEPGSRYASTEDLARELARVRDHASEMSSEALLPAVRRSLRVGRVALAALALLAAAGIGVVASRRPREEPPVYRQLTFRRGGVAGARFTPDGHTIVYSADWDGKPFQLFSTRTDSTESTPMPLPSADILSISSAGQMALGLLKPDFGHQILAEVSLAGGAPREILESEVDGVDEGFADWAPDGKSLAVARRVAGRSRLEWPIGKVLYESPDTFLRLPRFSPDGKSIAFVEAGAGQIPEQSIGLLETSGRKSTLSHGWNSIFGLNWNPKTSEIWFSGRESARGRGGLALHAVSPSGRHRVVARGPDSLVLKDIFRDGRVLLEHSQYSTTIAWLPPGGPKEIDLSWLQFSDLADLSEDGGTILFGEFVSGEGSAGGVYVRKTDGSAAVRLGEGVPAALSPDGKWVVSISSMGDRLQLLRTGAGESRDLSSKGMRYRDAKWFPDGRRIVLSARVEGRPPRLYVQDVTGGSPTPLTPEGFEIGPVSPDGKLVAARDPEGKVVLYPVAGGAPQVVPGLDSGDRVIRWDAKGEALFLGRGLLPARIDRFRLSSGKREALWQIEPGDRSGVGGIGNVFVTPDGRSYAYSYMRDLDCLYLVDGLH